MLPKTRKMCYFHGNIGLMTTLTLNDPHDAQPDPNRP